MRVILFLCLLALPVVYAFQDSPKPLRGPTPIIQPPTINSTGSKLTVLNQSEILVVNMIPLDQSDEHAQDSEPFLAVNKDPADARSSLMVGAAFRGPNQPGGATPLILLSNDGGATWKSKSMLSANQIAAQTYCFSGKGKNFYGSLMTIDGSERTVSVFHTEDPETDKALDNISTLSSGAEFGDAPFIQAHAFGNPPAAGQQESRSDRIYVGQNYFGFPGEQKKLTASIRVSVENGANFKLVGIETRDTGKVGQDGPAVRPAIANDGTIYAAFLHWSAKEGNGVRGDVVVTRDDQWAAAATNNFRALVDSSDGQPGRIVSRNVLFSFEKLGKQRIVSPLSLAVAPRYSEKVYIAWGDYDTVKKTHVLHVKRSSDKGQNWSEDLLAIPSATNPALAVSEVGVVGFLYQQLVDDESTGEKRWETHFRRSMDDGVTWTDVPLATFPTAVEPKSESDSSLGSRSHLVSVWYNFYGVFSAPNLPNQKYFPQGVAFQRKYGEGQLLSSDGKRGVPVSIDPYFFRIDLTPAAVVKAPSTDGGSNILDAASGSRYFVFLAVLVGVLLSIFAIVHARRLVKAREEVYSPALINYSGYVILRFTDFDGHPIELNNSISDFRLIVKFAKKLPEGEIGEEINLAGGKDAPEVVFTIVIDSIDYDARPDHITDEVPARGTREFTFDMRRSERGDGQSLFVQIYQKTQLVQVVSPRSVGPRRKSASL